MTTELEIEQQLIDKLSDLKYRYRPDIRDRAALEQNFRDKFQSLNRVSLTDAEFAHLRDKRVVFILDECRRSQFGENHRAIKAFFPRAQLFGFTGTPIFDDNASYKQVEGDVQTLMTTEDIFQKQLHAYTITHAIDDGNVLRFHIDYFKPVAPTSGSHALPPSSGSHAPAWEPIPRHPQSTVCIPTQEHPKGTSFGARGSQSSVRAHGNQKCNCGFRRRSPSQCLTSRPIP